MKNKGLYNKYIVVRTDGTSKTNGKHEHCKYFVLDLTHDPYAAPALSAYINACREEYPMLAVDLGKLGDIMFNSEALYGEG